MASSSQKSAVKTTLLGKRKAGDDLENKPFLRKHKEKSDSLQEIKGRVELLEAKSDEANLISVKEPAGPRNTVFICSLPPQTEISDVIDFFKDVGKVVRVRLVLTREGNFLRQGFVEFASSDEAKKALEKNGEHLHDCEIFVTVASKKAFPPKYCIDHKRFWYEDNLRRGSPHDQTPEFVEAYLLIANLSPLTTRISDIINFFKGVAKVISVRLIVDHEGKHVGYGVVKFASANQAVWAMEDKNGEYLHDHKILLMKGQYKKPGSDQVVSLREKTLFVDNLSDETKISDVINFFKDVGKVVHVRLAVDDSGKHVGYGFVEFTSANVAKNALEKKKGESLHDREIILDVVKRARRTTFCIDHKVWYEDNLRREYLDDEIPDSVEEKTVFVVNQGLRKHELCDMSDVIKRFKDSGEVVGVRLIVDHSGEHVGCSFVEFASADEAKKAVQEMDSCWIYVKMAEIAPYPFRPKYKLYKLAKKLWYDDNLRRESLGLENRFTLNKHKHEKKEIFASKKTSTKTTFDDHGNAIIAGKKKKKMKKLSGRYCIDHKSFWYVDYPKLESDFVEEVLFVANLSPHTTKISHIIDFFKDVAEVFRVRLIVNHEGKHVGCGFVEFAYANQAKRALEIKNGEYLHDHKILLMKVPDETPDSAEVDSVREKTLFVDNLSDETEISDVIDFFKDVGKVVHVRLAVNDSGKHVGYGFVEFSTAKLAKKALERKKGGYLHDREIFLDVVKTDQCPRRPKYCIDHKVWYQDYLREYLHDETPDSVEEKTVFVANQALKKDALCNISNIINMFKKVGEVVGVRLIVDHRGEHVGCGFVEFASADEAKKVVQDMDGYSIFLKMAEIAPYPLRPKYKHAAKLWHEDNLRQGILELETISTLPISQGKKTIFEYDDKGKAIW